MRLAPQHKERAPGDDVQQLKYADTDIPYLALEILPDIDDCRSTVRLRAGSLQHRIRDFFDCQQFVDVGLVDVIAHLCQKGAR